MGEKNNSTSNTERTNEPANDTSAETTSAERKRGRGRPRKSEQPNGSAAERETEPNIPRLVLVEEPGAENENEEMLHKPKNTSKSKKRKDVTNDLSKQQISVLLKTTFDIMGSRPGLELWKISQQESDLIADPLAQLLNKNPFVSGLTNKYGDYIALIAALCTVVLPRLFVQMATKKEKNKKEVKPYVNINKPNEQPNKEPAAGNNKQGGTIGNSNKQFDKRTTNPSPFIGNELYNIVPAIQ